MHDFASFASPLPHPGEILREDFMAPLGITAGKLAKAMGLKDRTRIERIYREAQPITADTALRLGAVLGTTPQFWINLQTSHDLSVAALAVKDDLVGLEPLNHPGGAMPLPAPVKAKAVAPKRAEPAASGLQFGPSRAKAGVRLKRTKA